MTSRLLSLLLLFLSLKSEASDLSLFSYFKADQFTNVSLSPDGKLVSVLSYFDQTEAVEVINPETQKSYVIFSGEEGVDTQITDIDWLDGNSIYVRVWQREYDTLHIIVHVSLEDGVISSANAVRIYSNGYVVNPLIREDNRILFARTPHRLDNSKTGLYRIDITDANTIRDSFSRKNRVARKVKDAFYWQTDIHGQARFILSYDDDMVVYHHLDPERDKFIEIAERSSEDMVLPLHILPDTGQLVVLDRNGNDKKGVYLVNPATLNIEETVYYNPTHDVDGIITDKASGELKGIRYTVDGMYRTRYLGTGANDQASRQLSETYPEDAIYELAASLDRKHRLYLRMNYATGENYHWYDETTGNHEYIIDSAPWLRDMKKARLNVIKTETADDLIIEGYLSIPPIESETFPLIVMPHGGPIGVRDRSYYDPVAHFMANFGIATLKVNYRGSSGFGENFEQSGKRQWGKQIEDDIDQMVSQVIRDYPIAANQICASGSSYGGYSALMLIIRFPDRYRCAVSTSGVTDIPLMFNSSDWSVSESLREEMYTIVGNPNEDIASMKAVSPVYMAEKIKAPVFLIHGTEDRRVEIEHSHRLVMVMNALGREVELLEIEDAGHGFSTLQQQVLALASTMHFLDQNLQLPVSFIDYFEQLVSSRSENSEDEE